ncbi:hypothetical protein QQ054_16900 [Oscillatoria amoena NRMC-F 0135]|nr:hypothetical protein [Oscillatoria amoena NRMC-F 0135]
MKLQVTWRNAVAFLLFGVLMGESHEIAHFLVGKIICGCWPESRDFNAWSICKSCKETNPHWYWPTAAGPIFSMALAWTGMFMLKSGQSWLQSLGFVLIWANVPQARLLTVFSGGGDETVVMRNLTSATEFEPYFRYFSYAVVVLMTLPPIIASFRTVKSKWGWLYSLGFMIVPMLLLGAYGFFFLNRLLEEGFLSNVWIMGTPLFITLHTVLVLSVLLLFFRKDLFTLVKDNGRQLVA